MFTVVTSKGNKRFVFCISTAWGKSPPTKIFKIVEEQQKTFFFFFNWTLIIFITLKIGSPVRIILMLSTPILIK